MVKSISHPLTFTAEWTCCNQDLKDSLIEKTSKFALHFLHKLAVGYCLPSSETSTETTQKKRRTFDMWAAKYSLDPIPVEITTPDAVKIKGTFIKLDHCDTKSPLIIFSQPNSCISTNLTCKDFIKEALEKFHNCNFLIYDYRGCGESEGTGIMAKDFVIDAEAVYQFASEKLRVPKENIHMMGYSFGGAVSAQVKAIHPECTGNYVNDRSFTAITDVAKIRFPSKIISYLAYGIMNILGWGILNTAKALQKIKSRVLIIFHPQDQVVAGLSNLYLKVPTLSNFSTMDLSKRGMLKLATGSVHGLRLKHFRYPNGSGAHVDTLKFLLEK